MSKILSLFQKGQSVTNPVFWKHIQISSTLIASIIIAIVNILSSFGYSIPIDIDTANNIGVFIMGVINVVLTFTTSDKIGVGGNNATE